MKKNIPQTSLERSHSKKSNAALTLLSFVSSILFSFCWISLGFVVTSSSELWILALVASFILFVISLIGFSKFTR